jgi:DNA topoisomerase-3
MKLVIAEKPNAGMEIAKALGATHRKDGYIEGNGYIVTWCVGHLATLKEPHDYDLKYKKWNFNDLPIIPNRYELKVVPIMQKQFDVVKKFLTNGAFEYVVNAADAGREGELIFDNVYRLAGSKLEVKRLWTSAALTEDAIRREFANLKPSSQYEGLKLAARAWAASDWVIGMNATRALTLCAGAHGKPITIGRVQTPTLSFLVTRELEIKNFKPKAFISIEGQFLAAEKQYKGILQVPQDEDKKLSPRMFDQTQAELIFLQLKDQKTGLIDSMETARKKILTPELFDLTELQKEANKIYGFTADETLKIAQSLYEKHKVLSYPRTDFKHLPNEMKVEMVKILFSLKGHILKQNEVFFDVALQRVDEVKKRLFDDSKVGDHHALLPMAKIPNNLDDGETKIYELVLKRLLSALNNDHIYDETTVVTSVKEHKFYSKGKLVIQDGWKQLYSFKFAEENQQNEEEQIFPNFEKNMSVDVVEIKSKKEKTKPPKQLTESDLLNCMQNPQNSMNKISLNLDQKNILKEKGIGTPATRANIIKALVQREYAIRKGKNIIPTEKAIVLITNLKPESLTSPIMTAEWEEKLVLIEQGKMKALDFAKELTTFVHEIVKRSGECAKTLNAIVNLDKIKTK